MKSGNGEWLIAMALFCSVAQAGPYADGLAAIDASYYAVAHQLLEPLAREGHAEAAAAIKKMEQEGHHPPGFMAGGDGSGVIAGFSNQGLSTPGIVTLSPTVLSAAVPGPNVINLGASSKATDRAVRAAVAKAEADAKQQRLQLELTFEGEIAQRLVVERRGELVRAERLKPHSAPHPFASDEVATEVVTARTFQPVEIEGDFTVEYQQTLTNAMAGDVAAARALGDPYLQGIGVSRDGQQAAHWYRQAADAGDSESCFKLGHAYFNGSGLPLSYREAYRWWLMAAAQGHTGAVSYLRILQGRISPVERRQAEYLVANG